MKTGTFMTVAPEPPPPEEEAPAAVVPVPVPPVVGLEELMLS